MTIKPLATGIVALAIVGATAAGVTSVSPAGPTDPQVQIVVFGVPLPLDPAEAVPTPGEVMAVLNGLQAQGVPFASKANLIEGGLGPFEAGLADSRFQEAVANGALPLAFNVANIRPAGPGAATADITASGPKLAPATRNVRFVNQGTWKIARASALALVQEAGVGA
ncbi:hypothetical protein [Mycobacterium sp.]|uniref:hypothetical protein n=1 Tax=Mycobacterium sp. TaxID=1785 RepID=UPI002CDF160B|nr:hypothetical protein [Mycobacterium sp.]HTQ17991.1 hypothetical protein [Mycobacterium sp.]